MNKSNHIPWISPDMHFPTTDSDVSEFTEFNGLIAASDRLSSKMLVNAYHRGIFPWSGKGQPILWWSPNPRMVLNCDEFILHNSLKKKIKSKIKNGMRLTCNKAFKEVITACAAPRPNQKSSWITPEIIDSYYSLHQKNLAHSIEVWQENNLIGGLYAVALGRMVFGESMFHRQSDASKIAFTALVKWLITKDANTIDCQQETKHLANFGARPIERKKFEKTIQKLTSLPELPWSSDPPSTEIFF
jgi:leucyl/phenylalanyl-tRNA--protein transferase